MGEAHTISENLEMKLLRSRFKLLTKDRDWWKRSTWVSLAFNIILISFIGYGVWKNLLVI